MQVVWSVARADSNTFGAQNPLTFSTIVINIGKAWNSTLNAVVIKAAGTYFIQIDLGTCSNGGSIMEVWKNNDIAFQAQSPLQFSGGASQARGHAAVLKLIIGDLLFIKVPATPSACIYGGLNHQTTFCGLLLAFV